MSNLQSRRVPLQERLINAFAYAKVAA